MKVISLSIIILLFSNTAVFSQVMHGLILNGETEEPVALANIGILDSRKGTYSTDKGRFSLKLTSGEKNSILVISAIGFESRKISLSEVDIENELKVILTPKEYELTSFTVKKSRIRTKTVGNRWLPLKINRMAWTANIAGERIGKTIAIQIELKQQPPIRIDEISVGVFENPWREAHFRARVLSIDSTGQPGEDLINLGKISTMTNEHGWVHFTYENNAPLVKTNEFFLVVENIDDSGTFRNPDELHGFFPIYMFNMATLSKQPVYLSNEGMQKWDKKPEDPTFRLKYAYE